MNPSFQNLISVAKVIPFNTAMVRAILAGNKTQTRRFADARGGLNLNLEDVPFHLAKSPRYKIDDILWVRESVKIEGWLPNSNELEYKYLADEEINWLTPLPLRFANPVPRWIRNRKGVPNGCIKEMARIFLKITDVKIEKIQDISNDDCLKEGIVPLTKDNDLYKYAVLDLGDTSSVPWQDMARSPKEAWIALWDSSVTSKDKTYNYNPYVFVYSFEIIKEK